MLGQPASVSVDMEVEEMGVNRPVAVMIIAVAVVVV